MGCGDHWPRCNGEWFPPLDLPTMIEIGHRWAAALVSLSVLAIAVVAWIRHRADSRALRRPATLALVLLVVQVLLGAVTVKLALPPWVDHHPSGQRHAAAGHPAGRGAPGHRPAGIRAASTRAGRHGAHGLVVWRRRRWASW